MMCPTRHVQAVWNAAGRASLGSWQFFRENCLEQQLEETKNQSNLLHQPFKQRLTLEKSSEATLYGFLY